MKLNAQQIFESMKGNNQTLALIAAILLQYNCRASEILEATWQDFKYPYFMILRGKKRSANIIIRDKWIIEEINKLPRLNKIFIFPYISYNTLYNYFKRNFGHLFAKYRTRKNNKVTHGPRYFAANIVNEADLIKDLLYHRSIKSGVFYNKQQKEN